MNFEKTAQDFMLNKDYTLKNVMKLIQDAYIAGETSVYAKMGINDNDD